MELKILIAFTDKHTGESYQKDTTKTFSKERAEELLADKRGLVEKVETSEAAPEEEPKPKKNTTKKNKR